MARELTDPGRHPAPTEGDIELALVEVAHDHPEAAHVLRRAIVALEAERFSVRLFREVVEHLERSTAAQASTALALDGMDEPFRRALELLAQHLADERRALDLRERRAAHRQAVEVAHGTTVLEHVKGAWSTVRAVASNKVVFGGAISVATWLVTRLAEWWGWAP